MSKFNPDLLVVLSNQLSSYGFLKILQEKHALTLYNVFTPGVIGSIDNEVSANPYVLSEAMALLETTAHLSMFYAEHADHDFLVELKRVLVGLRTSWNRTSGHSDNTESLHKDLMEEYFVTSAADFHLFLDHNPVYLGVYLFVYISTMTLA